jgi:stage V sporulation protein SpoVS
VLIAPRVPGGEGVILEFKQAEGPGEVEGALEAALAQIRDRRYVAELQAAGAGSVVSWAIAFDGKRVHVCKG